MTAILFWMMVLPGLAGVAPWIEQTLNGAGTHNWFPWYPGMDGDLLAGEIVDRGMQSTRYGEIAFFDVRVECATLDAQPFEPGSWARLFIGASVLKRWVERDDPQIGDRVAVRYRGVIERNGYRAHRFDAGTLKAERDELEEEASWRT